MSDVERAVLAFTDDVVANIRASDQTLAGLRRYFSERQVVELIMDIGCYHMVCMMLETCGVEIETRAIRPSSVSRNGNAACGGTVT